jgi:hypothetical protein
MHITLFKYSDQDLRAKFAHTVATNHVIGCHFPADLDLPGQCSPDLLSAFDDSNSGTKLGSLSDGRDLSSTNMSMIISNPEDGMLRGLLRPLGSGIGLFKDLQQMMVFRKKDDDFFDYKLKVYEVH